MSEEHRFVSSKGGIKTGSVNITKAHIEGKIKYDTFTGRKHNEETKQKIGFSVSKKQSGIHNSQYGTMWITNGIENKKIKKEDIIPEGWYKGRNKCSYSSKVEH